MSESQAGGRRLINATAVMASGTMVSRILGLVRTGRPDIGAYEFGARRNSASEWLTYP